MNWSLPVGSKVLSWSVISTTCFWIKLSSFIEFKTGEIRLYALRDERWERGVPERHGSFIDKKRQERERRRERDVCWWAEDKLGKTKVGAHGIAYWFWTARRTEESLKGEKGFVFISTFFLQCQNALAIQTVFCFIFNFTLKQIFLHRHIL